MNGGTDASVESVKDSAYRNTLHELNRVEVDETTDMTFFLNAILDIVARAACAEAGTLWLFSRSGDGRIHPKAQYGGSNLGGFSLAPGEGVAGNVIKTGEGTVIQDCQKDERWSGKVDAGTGFVTRSMICIPLLDSGIGFGCIQLINKTDGSRYDGKDMEFMNSLAKEIAALFLRHAGNMFSEFFVPSDRKEGFLFSAFASVDSEEELVLRIRKTPEYRKLDGFMAWQLENSCRSVWKLTH